MAGLSLGAVRKLEQAAGFAQHATAFPIRRATVREINSAIDACRRRLEGR